MRTRPIRHGMSVRPSGLFLSVLLRPVGSLVAGIPARTRLLQISSLRFACLAVLPGPNEQDSPWEPLALTIVAAWLSSLKPQVVTGSAKSQSLEWRAATALNRALS